MAQHPVFKSVRLPHNDKNSEGTTQLMNLRSENLFEVYNAAEIYDEFLSNPANSHLFNPSKITVKSVILDDSCFVCVDRTVHCFKIGSRADDSAVFELDAPPADICVVPGHKILLFLLQNGCICFFIPELSKLTSSKQIFNTPASTFKVAFGGFGPFLCLAVLASNEKQSEVKFVKFPPFEHLEHGSGVFFESTKLMKFTQNMNRCFVAGDKFGFTFFPQRKNNPILKQSAYSLHIESMSNAPLVETYSLPYGVQSVYQIGKLIGVLTDGLDCMLFDNLDDLVPAGALHLGGFRGNILDFAVLDFDDTVLNPSTRMILHVEGATKHKIVLTDVQCSRVAFEFECSEHICLNASTAQTELNNNVVIIESFSDKKPNSVRLRFIFEAQPEIRLRNLLDKGRFEEALDCARAYNLPLDQVYDRQIIVLIEGINADGLTSNEEVDKLLVLLEKLVQTQAQEENAFDYAFLAATSATDYAHIQKLVTFCKKCRVQDVNLLDNLDRLTYALETYRSLFGDEASYSRDSHWPMFWVGENHWSLFIEMLSESKIKKCSELWDRYRSDLSDLLVSQASDIFPQLLENLERTIAGSAGKMCKEVSKFMEKDLLPPFFTHENKSHLDPFREDLIDFFKRVSLSLWQLDQQHFPYNAYEFSSTISRLVKNLNIDASREKKQKLVESLNSHGVGVKDLSSPYIKLDRMVVKLQRLCYLHRTYKFTSSYEAFCDLTAEEIGNLLMEKIYTIPNNMVYVNETVFKYCDEVRLDRDTLLLNYIKKADLSKIVNVCIDMCKLFANDDFRAEAAMMIAPSRQLPWSPDMNQLFNNLIGLQSLPEMTQIQLKETRLRADISALMKPFGGDCLLGIEDSHDLLNYCTTLFSHTNIPIEERVNATHKICALSKQNTKITITPAECFVRAIKYSYATSHSIEQLDQTLCLLKHIKDLDVREEVARKCAVYAYQLLSTNSILDESIPLCAYFLIKISQYLTVDLKAYYVKKATLVCQLYELYRVVVFADKLNDKEECAQALISISTTNEEATIQDIIEIGALFSLTKEDVIVQLIVYFVQNELSVQVDEIFTLIPTLFDSLERDDLIEAIYYGLSYLLREFSNHSWAVVDIDRLSDFINKIREICLLVFNHGHNTFYFSKFLPIVEFVNFIETTMSYFKHADPSLSSSTTLPSEVQPRAAPQLSNEEEAFIDLEKRLKLPTYGNENDSTRFGDSNTVLKSACKIAESICQPMDYLKGWQTKGHSMPSILRTQWITLITILNNNQSYYLAVIATQICLKLDLFIDHQKEILVLYDDIVVKLLERQLAAFDVDWIQVMEELGYRGSKQSSALIKNLRENRNLVKNRLLVVNSYILKFIFTLRADTIQSSLEQFQRLSWQRELAGHGINISSKIIELPEKFMSQLVDQLVSPSVVVSLCRSFNKNPDSKLLLYALNLCIAHSQKINLTRRSLLLKCAQEALELIAKPTLELVRNFLMALDQSFFPYDYEAIQVALDWCQKHCKDAQNSDWVNQMQKLLAFLRIHKRRANYTQNELDWFYNRDKKVVVDPDMTINGTTQQPKAITELQDPYQLSLVRLPFQVFLAADENGKTMARKIVIDQITTETLHDWICLSIQLPRLLSFTKVFLESSTICSDLQRCLDRRMLCDEKLMLRVISLITSNKNQLSILSHVSSGLSKVVQSEHKVKVFESLTSLLEERLKNEKTEFASNEEAEKAKQMYTSLMNGRNVYFVLNLLVKYRLLTTKTSQLSGKINELCRYIFKSITKWQDLDEIEYHVRFVKELDKQGLIKTDAFFSDLFNDWLKNSKIDLNVSGMAMDETMELESVTGQESNIEDSGSDPKDIFLSKYLHARVIEGL